LIPISVLSGRALVKRNQKIKQEAECVKQIQTPSDIPSILKFNYYDLIKVNETLSTKIHMINIMKVLRGREMRFPMKETLSNFGIFLSPSTFTPGNCLEKNTNGCTYEAKSDHVIHKDKTIKVVDGCTSFKQELDFYKTMLGSDCTPILYESSTGLEGKFQLVTQKMDGNFCDYIRTLLQTKDNCVSFLPTGYRRVNTQLKYIVACLEQAGYSTKSIRPQDLSFANTLYNDGSLNNLYIHNEESSDTADHSFSWDSLHYIIQQLHGWQRRIPVTVTELETWERRFITRKVPNNDNADARNCFGDFKVTVADLEKLSEHRQTIYNWLLANKPPTGK